MRKISIKNTISLIDQKVNVFGWVEAIRKHGKILFIDLRDETGILQVVFTPDNKEMYELAEKIRPEWVINIKGEVKARPEKMVNENIETGKVELNAEEVKIISQAKTIPFPIDTDGYEISEEKRLKYRYLDLRRKRVRKNIEKRHKTINFIRNFLDKKDFIEIETPILTKSTPEGARDFVVPSRIEPGKFFALPQSPQQYKQLLMVAGFEKYFQIAKCLRDEDMRADRQPEFTQLDIEMSFVSQKEMLETIESLFIEIIKNLFPEKRILETPFPRITYQEAIKKYNSDRPDLRKNKEDSNELAFAFIVDFPLFTPQTDQDYFHGSGSAKFAPSHHMFTAPKKEDIPLLDSDPLKVKSYQHDLILNGWEIGGGSIRIHNPEIQDKIFDLIGFTKQQKQEFKHLLEAFEYGVPVHGGIAFGFDRFLSIALNEPNIREVITFPKTGDGKDLMMEAPSEISPEQLKELNIKINKKDEK